MLVTATAAAAGELVVNTHYSSVLWPLALGLLRLRSDVGGGGVGVGVVLHLGLLAAARQVGHGDVAHGRHQGALVADRLERRRDGALKGTKSVKCYFIVL